MTNWPLSVAYFVAFFTSSNLRDAVNCYREGRTSGSVESELLLLCQGRFLSVPFNQGHFFFLEIV